MTIKEFRFRCEAIIGKEPLATKGAAELLKAQEVLQTPKRTNLNRAIENFALTMVEVFLKTQKLWTTENLGEETLQAMVSDESQILIDTPEMDIILPRLIQIFITAFNVGMNNGKWTIVKGMDENQNIPWNIRLANHMYFLGLKYNLKPLQELPKPKIVTH
jgi:hypothetical protein